MNARAPRLGIDRWGHLVLGALCASAVACGAEEPRVAARRSAPDPVLGPAPLQVPETRAALLDLLSPVPDGGVTVRYRISGPSGLGGELVVDLAPGGLRREMWSMTLEVGEGVRARRVEGLTIQTPDQLWTGIDDEPGTTTPVPLGALADAFLEQPDERRRAIAQQITRWRRELSAAQREVRGQSETVAGQACLVTQIAGQDLCLWESTGLPLRYRSAEFELEAFSVERGARRDPDAFALPERAAEATPTAPDDALVLDPARALDQIAAGDMAPLAFVVTPGLRMPG